MKQSHLLGFIEELSGEEKESLLSKVKSIDYDMIEELYKSVCSENVQTSSIFAPPEVVDKNKLSDEELRELADIGTEIVKSNQYAVVSLAGGQGTRLEFDGPKALYQLQFLNGKTLIELQAEKILEAQNRIGGIINWYIMTNVENQDIIQDFIMQKNYFGLNQNNIKLFPQGNIPLIDKNGKILMENKYTIIEVPDGNGGIYEAMEKNGVTKDLKDKNIKYVLTCNIDNILANLADTVYIGFTEKNNALISSKSILKKNAKERVGAFCIKDNRPAIVEYSDISEEMAEQENVNGELVYGDSFIGYMMLNTEILDVVKTKKMPYHKAIKKYSYINDDGDIVVPTEPNAYKFEKFIFDIFPYVEKLPILRVKRDEEFAPIKNKDGEDSPKSAEELYVKYMKV